MTDLVERLRQGVGNLPEDCMDAEKWMDKAADEIERLRKIELQFLALKEERPRWRADNEWLTQDNDRLRAFEWAWHQLSADLRQFVAAEAPPEIRRALDGEKG